jgi:hypothetical protein
VKSNSSAIWWVYIYLHNAANTTKLDIYNLILISL